MGSRGFFWVFIGFQKFEFNIILCIISDVEREKQESTLSCFRAEKPILYPVILAT